MRSVSWLRRAQARVWAYWALIGLGGVHGLADPDVGPEQLGVSLHGERGGNRAPGVRQQVDAIGVEPVAEVVGGGNGVVHLVVQGHAGRRFHRRIGAAPTTAVQGGDDEVSLQLEEVRADRTSFGCPGGTGYEQQDRLGPVDTADHQAEPMRPACDGRELGDAALPIDRGGTRRHGHRDRREHHDCRE